MIASAGVLALFLTAVPSKRPVLVTVDDLPIAANGLHTAKEARARITEGMLAALAKHHIKAVGLVTWSRVRAYPEGEALLERWVKAGHELGNHSFSHSDYTTTETQAFLDDVASAQRELDAFLDRAQRPHARFFRFPFLDEGDTPEKLAAMRSFLAAHALRNLPVTIDNQDWSFEKPYTEAKSKDERAAIAADYQAAFRYAFQHHEHRGDQLFGREVPDILLLHATLAGAEQWDALFTWLERTGHRFATADEVLADAAFAEPYQLTSPKGFGLWDRIRAERKRAELDKEVRALLVAQAQAWNRGDLDAFCAVYAPDATFISPSGLTQGRDAILARYRAKYSTKAKMGTLDFDFIEVRLADGWEVSMFGDAVPSRVHAASVIMRWRLSYPDKEPASGLSLVTLHPTESSWRIVQDASM